MYFAVMYNSSMFEIYVLTDRQTDRQTRMFERLTSNVSAAILAALLCIRLMSKAESCPYQSSTYSNTLKRVISHIRYVHDPVEIPLNL